jgi:hypothetical protein
MWLLNRLFNAGDQPTPRFAFQGTVNWMRGLAMVCVNNGFSPESLNHFYGSVNRRAENVEADTLAFECLVMAMHNVSSLDQLLTIANPYGVVRSSIVAWYYAIYYASKAMLAASTGVNPQTHARTGKLWQTEFVNRGLVQRPFDLSIQNLTPNNIKTSIGAIRAGNNHDLNTEPNNLDTAWGAIYSYLSGTSDYEKWRLEEQVRESPEFKKGGFVDFRKKDAKLLRDAKLSPAVVNFLVQAFRYRGKANYRDAIYLSYGSNYSETLKQFVEDLSEVAGAFVLMAAYYASKRVAKDSWVEFGKDINENARFELPFNPEKI